MERSTFYKLTIEIKRDSLTLPERIYRITRQLNNVYLFRPNFDETLPILDRLVESKIQHIIHQQTFKVVINNIQLKVVFYR